MIPLVIGGAASGVGKTTVSVGLMGAYRRRGMSVAPFKTGPDYIDPSYHLAVTGSASRNLDTWLTPESTVRDIFTRGSAAADVAVIEGAMGLFDGRSGEGNRCSTAEIARLTGGVVLLVVDCARQARSLAPVLAGFAAFDPSINLAGAILNNVGSTAHARVLKEAASEAGIPVIGVLPRRGDISLKSRHLGLVPAGENVSSLEERLERIIDHISANVDIEAVLSMTKSNVNGIQKAGSGIGEEGAGGRQEASGSGARNKTGSASGGSGASSGGVRIGVALDEAFSFYYPDSLEALEAEGAKLVYFSPLRDNDLPACEGLYFGGGYPEVFADRLQANTALRRSVAAAIKDGVPVYAECGGLVYLSRAVEIDGSRKQMAGALPLEARMTGRRQALGYVEATARHDNLLMASGERVRGHEFHWSDVSWQEDNIAYECYSNRDLGGKPEGFSSGNVLASYVHLHFAGNPRLAKRLIAVCSGNGEVGAHATG